MTLHGRRLARVISYEMKCALCVLALTAAASPAFGGEYVVFSSGLKLRADRHEESGGVIRLFYNGGITEVPAQLVSGFEEEELATPEQVIATTESGPLPSPNTQAPNIQAPNTQGNDPKAMVRDAARPARGFRRNSSKASLKWNRDSGLTRFRRRAPWESCN